MREVRWQIEEQFCFPPKLGVIKKVKTFSVQPKWQMRTFNQSVQLLGIYHMKASVLFKDGRAEPLGILIEDFDFNDDNAYFEYAFPLKVDLPNGNYRDISLTIVNEKATISSANNLIVSFEVVCKFNTKKRTDADDQQSPTQLAVNEEILSEVTLGKTVHSQENETTLAQVKNNPAMDEKIAVAKLEDTSNSIASTTSTQNVDSSLAAIEEVAIDQPQATQEKVAIEQPQITQEKVAIDKSPVTQEKVLPTASEHITTSTKAPTPSTLKTHKASPTPIQEEQQTVAVSTTNFEQSNSELDFLANLPEDYSELIVQSNKIRP
jgi:hypothetical protein